jgi:preprotein translocase subunit SecD
MSQKFIAAKRGAFNGWFGVIYEYDASGNTEVRIWSSPTNRDKKEQAIDDATEKARKILLDAIGGIHHVVSITMQPNFLKVATDEAFESFLAGCDLTNRQAEQLEKARTEKEAADKIEAKRLADEKTAQDLKDAEARETQRKADDEQRAALKKQADELATKQAELDKQAADQKAEAAKIAADQKSAQDKIDSANKKIADDLAAVEQKKLDDIETAKRETYDGNPRFAWRFEKPTKPAADSPFKSLAPFATYSFTHKTSEGKFDFSFKKETGDTVNFQMDREETVRLHECLTRILASDAANSMSGDQS